MTHESTGAVAPGSLAAESLSSGGEFASNPTSTSQNTSSNLNTTQPHETPSSYASKPTEQGSAAPSYVQVPSAVHAAGVNEGGPKGANLTEDPGMTGRPGADKAFAAEIGSKDDPSREALHAMRLKQTRGAPGTGEREVGERGKDEQPYAALGRETSA